MKIIFLDIDGPIIPATALLLDNMASWSRSIPDWTLNIITELCDRTGAKIVFNTVHNTSVPEVMDIKDAFLNAGFNPEYIHEDSHTLYPRVDRRNAVESWLFKHPEVTHWVAIDDNRFIESNHLIYVDSDYGLGVKHLNWAIEQLGLLEGKNKVYMLI